MIGIVLLVSIVRCKPFAAARLFRWSSQKRNENVKVVIVTISEKTQIRIVAIWHRCLFWLTSEMSHAGSWRAACSTTNNFLSFHFENAFVARGVTDPSVSSGALFGFLE
jgi:hypothetical protein